MAMTPRDIQNMRFSQKMRGYDTQEVDNFLGLAAEELQQALADSERLQRETREQRDRLRESEDKEKQLQEALLRAQRVADVRSELVTYRSASAQAHDPAVSRKKTRSSSSHRSNPGASAKNPVMRSPRYSSSARA